MSDDVRRFRKKPVVVEAMQYDTQRPGLMLNFLRNSDNATLDDEGLVIHTLEGDMKAFPGDWIIRGVAGEFYPCKPDIFEATYEPLRAGWTPWRLPGRA